MRTAIRTVVIALAATAAVAIPGTAHADRSNTIGGATTLNANYTAIKENLNYAGDVDYFRFKNPAAGYVRIVLNSLPKDYALQVYDATGKGKGMSSRPGLAHEEIYRYLAAGTYFVKVYSPSKQASSSVYSVAFRPLSSGVHVLSSKSYKDGIGNTWVFGEVLNNTSGTKSFMKLTAKFYNSSNQVVKTGYGYADSYNMAPRARATFSMVSDPPTTAVRYTLTPSWSSTAYGKSVVSFTTKVTKQSITNGRFFHFEGTVTNKTGGYADDITVQNARYDKYGNITTTGSGTVLRKRSDGSSTGTLANGATGTFSGGYYALSGTIFQIWRTTGTRSDGTGAGAGERPRGRGGGPRRPTALPFISRLLREPAMRLVVRAAIVALVAATVALPTAASADRSNTLGGATSNSPLHTIVKETIGSGTDVDWFRFTTTRGTHSRILLTDVPKDYALQVYDAAGKGKGMSSRPGRAFEEIYRYLPAGTYYLKVYSPTKQYSSTPYSLAFRPMNNSVVVLSSRWFRPHAGYAEVHGEVLNNTSTSKAHLVATVRFHDSSGKVVHSVTDHTASNYTDPRTRTVFMAYSYNVPASAVRYSVSVSWSGPGYTTKPNLAGLALQATSRSWPSYVDFEGTVTNKTGGAARAVEVTQTRYTAAGTVYSVASMPVKINETLANGESGRFHGQAENSSAVTFARWAVFGHR